MVTYVIKASMGEDCSTLKMVPSEGCWANYMVHTNETGLYAGIWFDEQFKKNNLVDYVTDIKVGDAVHKFRDAQDCTGELILRFENTDTMFNILSDMDKYVKVLVSK